MHAVIRRKFSMARSVLAFERANPSEDASHQGVVNRLADLIDMIGPSFYHQFWGRQGVHAAAKRRKDLRRNIRKRLCHLVTVVSSVSRREIGICELFTLPKYYIANMEFIGHARAMLQQATDHATLLAEAGLGDSFFDDLAREIDEFDIASRAFDDGFIEHVSATSGLDELARDVINCVNILHGLNIQRFAQKGELLAAWDSARNVYGPVRRKAMGDVAEAA